jgi:hypothetical protein
MSSNIGRKLDQWLLKHKLESFPGGGSTDYPTQYKNVANYLNKHVHPEVEKGAAIHDEHHAMFLNNHGPEHVAAVIGRISDMLTAANCKITPYEGYLLLFAAHLHDTGNLFGRSEHEKGCREVMKQLGSRAGDDELEKKTIIDIASAHGGRTPEGNKDTISALIPEPESRLLNQDVRAHFLAALLRFGDELADDRSRASRFSMEAGAVPEESKLYHQYSQSLQSVTVGEREIKLDFDLSTAIANQRFAKTVGDAPSQIFLLDEIFERTLKMHTERMYCMRFLRPSIRLDEVRVNIEVFNLRDGRYGQRIEQIQYRLLETGYPGKPSNGIRDLCPDLQWTGASLQQRVNRTPEAA